MTARSDVLDIAHSGEGGSARTLRRRLDEMEIVEAALRRAGRADAVEDHDQGECAYVLLVGRDEAPLRLRESAEILARLAATRSLCEVERGAVEEARGECGRLVVHDGDGGTTVRAGPRSSSASRGILRNGEPIEVLERRGSWVRVREPSGGWVHRDHVHCVTAPTRERPAAPTPE